MFATALGIAVLVAVGGGTAAETEESDAANITLYTTDNASFDDGAAIESALENGTLEPADEVVVGDTLLVDIESERLAAALDGRDGGPTDRFFATLDDGATFRLVQTNTGPNVAPKVIRLGPDNTTVYRSGDRTVVSIETGAVTPAFDPPQETSTDSPTLRGGEQFAVVFGYDGEEPRHGPEITFESVEAAFVDTAPVLAPEIVNKSVRVTVPADTLSVRATFDDGTRLTETPASVPWSEFLGVSLDLRDVTPGANYTLEVVHDGAVVDRQRGVVREPAARLWDPSVTVTGTEEHVAELTVTAELSHGGTVLVLDGFGSQVGAARVPPATTTELSIALRNPNPATSFDPDRLRVQALRDGDQVERQYPGDAAELTLDVSEYAWNPTNWTRTPTQSAPTPTDTDESNDTVGDGASTDGGELGGFVTGIGLFGALSVLAGTGYVFRRRLVDQ